jgi:hypothetical protein
LGQTKDISQTIGDRRLHRACSRASTLFDGTALLFPPNRRVDFYLDFFFPPNQGVDFYFEFLPAKIEESICI